MATPQKGFVEHRLRLVNELWAAGIKAEFSYKANPKALDQFQYCEEKQVPFCVVIGEGEIANNTVIVRDTSVGKDSEVSRLFLPILDI